VKREKDKRKYRDKKKFLKNFGNPDTSQDYERQGKSWICQNI